MNKTALRYIFTYKPKWNLNKVLDKETGEYKYQTFQYCDTDNKDIEEIHYYKYLEAREVYFRITKKEYDKIRGDNEEEDDEIVFGRHPLYKKEMYCLNGDYDCEVSILVDKKRFGNFKKVDEDKKFIILIDKNCEKLMKAYKNNRVEYQYQPYITWELNQEENEKYKHHLDKYLEALSLKPDKKYRIPPKTYFKNDRFKYIKGLIKPLTEEEKDILHQEYLELNKDVEYSDEELALLPEIKIPKKKEKKREKEY